jgi:hypothetical protein
MNHPTFTRRVFASLALLGLATGARAQGFPSRPVRLLVGYSPGGAVDLIARAVAQPLGSALGQPVVVDNKPGAGTNIAMRALIDGPPDGHTLMLVDPLRAWSRRARPSQARSTMERRATDRRRTWRWNSSSALPASS